MDHSDSWLPQGNFRPHRYRPGGIGNWSGHLPFAHDLVAAVRPELLVELGTHYGESYFGFCQSVAENNLICQCHAVDTWVGETHAGFYDESVYQSVQSYNAKSYSAFSYLLRMTFDEARKNFSNESIDILHIDGLHTYEAVTHDIQNWLPAVKPGGIILLHDTSARHADFGVWKAWEELENLGERFAFSHSWGLGVFRKAGGELTNPFLSALFSVAPERQQHIRQFYALCARSLEYEHFRPNEQDAHGPTDLIRVYPEGENGYSADSVYEGLFKTKEWVHATVEIASGSSQGGLRVDITERPGVIDVSGISVRKAVNDELIYRATGAAELAALEVGGTLTALENAETTGFCRYINSGNDPQLYLKLDPKLTDQPLMLDLWLRFNDEVSILLPWLKGNSKQKSELAESANALRFSLSELEVEKSELARLANTLRTEIAGLETEKNDLKQKLSSMSIDRESSMSNYARLQRESYLLKKDLALANLNREDLEAKTKDLEAKSKDLEAKSKDLEAKSKDLEAKSKDLEAKISALEQEKAKLEETMHGVLASRSWKLTRPIRRFMERRREG